FNDHRKTKRVEERQPRETSTTLKIPLRGHLDARLDCHVTAQLDDKVALVTHASPSSTNSTIKSNSDEVLG
ncbi:hypothetical protein X801_00922, partial [Opisthorchis viverrini]